MKLSIIIPYYETFEYTKKLLEVLIPQLTDEVEVLIIDDGCGELMLDYLTEINNNIIVIHSSPSSGGASRPRNIGLNHAKGKYIAFIDSDDMVSENYISKILKVIEKEPDIIYISWMSKVHKIIMNIKAPKWNCSVWCRVYKREIIGDTRFDENLRIAEDWKFNQAIKYQKSACIKDILYIYNNGREGSLLNGGTK